VELARQASSSPELYSILSIGALSIGALRASACLAHPQALFSQPSLLNPVHRRFACIRLSGSSAGPVQPALWYSIYSCERLNQLMIEAEAGDDVEGYLRRNGHIMSKLLQKSGPYAQLKPADAGEKGSAGSFSERSIKRTLSLWHAMVNFGRWSCRAESDDPPVFRFDVDEAEHYVHVLRVANAGFLEGVFGYLADAPGSV
jgi:hypothetical protein